MSGAATPEARVVLRPRGLLECCDLSLRWLASNAKAYARLSLWVLVPGMLASLGLRYVLELDAALVWMISIGLAAIAEAPFTVLSGKLGITHKVTTGEVMRAFARRALPFLLITLAAGVFQAGAFMLMFVPWVFAAMVVAFLPEVVLLEGDNLRAFKRSYRVIFGHNGTAFGLVLLRWVVAAAAVVVAEVALRRSLGVLLDVKVHVESLFTDGCSPYALFGLWLSVPVVAVFRYMAYIDLRTRREGWDLKRRFDLLAARLAGEGR